MLPPWYRPIAPRTVVDAAWVLAEHVDYWEEDTIAAPWPRCTLSAFMGGWGFADESKETQFRNLLEEYVTLSINTNTVRSRHSDNEFHSRRRQSVRDAIGEIKRWVGDGEQPLPRAGTKRMREQGASA